MAYFDEQAGAASTGFQHGHVQGTQEGLRQGRSQGFSEGCTAGYQAGWCDAVKLSNVEMTKQYEYTRHYLDANQALTSELHVQNQRFDQIANELEAVKDQNENLVTADKELRDVIHALKAALETRTAELTELEHRYRSQSREFDAHIWQYNQVLIFSEAARKAIHHLVVTCSDHRVEVAKAFCVRYSNAVDQGLIDGTIRSSLTQDDALVNALPGIHDFVLRMRDLIEPVYVDPTVADKLVAE